MENDRKSEEILLKEYGEAGQVCRHYETLTRTSLSIFLPFFTAVIGYLLSSAASAATKLGLSIAGFLISLLLLNTIIRLQAYYRSYIDRSKEIEKLIGPTDNPLMRLYTAGEKATSGSCTISNKTAIAVVIGLAAVYFFVSAIIYGYQLPCVL